MQRSAINTVIVDALGKTAILANDENEMLRMPMVPMVVM